jgi:hypothetical protein
MNGNGGDDDDDDGDDDLDKTRRVRKGWRAIKYFRPPWTELLFWEFKLSVYPKQMLPFATRYNHVTLPTYATALFVRRIDKSLNLRPSLTTPHIHHDDGISRRYAGQAAQKSAATRGYGTTLTAVVPTRHRL